MHLANSMLIVRITSLEENPACLLDYLCRTIICDRNFGNCHLSKSALLPVVFTDPLDKQKLTFGGWFIRNAVGRAAEQRNELAPFHLGAHSITSSAMLSSEG